MRRHETPLFAELATARSAMAQQLEAVGHANIDVAAADTELIQRVRSAARGLGREHGWRIRTFEVVLSPTVIRVFVGVTEADPLREQLWRARARTAVRRALQG